MTNKWQGYVLNVQGVVCWRKTINEDNQEVFIKAMIDEPFELYIEKLKEKLKDMNTSGNSIDVVTGRVFKIIEQEESIMLLPSCIAMNKNSMIKHHDVFTKGLCVLKDEERLSKYTEVSEDIILNSFFCEKISNELELSIIPAYLIDRVIKEFRQANENARIRSKE